MKLSTVKYMYESVLTFLSNFVDVYFQILKKEPDNGNARHRTKITEASMYVLPQISFNKMLMLA